MLPPPLTFGDGQRQLYGLAAGVAGVAFGLAVLVGASIVVFGDWGLSLLPTQLYILGGCLAVGSLGTIAVTIGLLVGGPVGRIRVKADKSGAELEAAAPGETTKSN